MSAQQHAAYPLFPEARYWLPPIHFELGFARAAGADTAAQAGKMGPLARETRQQIFELCQLDLQLAFVAARALGENIENELAAVDDPDFERRFQIALLRRGQILVHDHEIGMAVAQRFLDLVDLAAADQRRRRNAFYLLAVPCQHRRAAGFGQLFELLKTQIERRLPVARGQRHPDKQGGLFRRPC